jgi:hypothetical protein
MNQSDADNSQVASPKNLAPVLLKTEAINSNVTPAASPVVAPAANNDLQPDKAAQAPKFVSCMASDRTINEAVIDAIIEDKPKQ